MSKVEEAKNNLKLSDSDIKYLKEIGHTDEDIPQIEEALNDTVYTVADVEKAEDGTTIIPDEEDDKVITAQEAREILGDETFLSGLSRSAFHWTSGRYNADETKYVGFDSSKLFESKKLHEDKEEDIKHLEADLETNLEELLLNGRYKDINEIKTVLENNGIVVNSLAEDGPKDEDDTTDLSLVGNVEYTMGFDIELFYILTRAGDMYITECNVLEQYDECLTEVKERFTCPECKKDINELFECDGKYECPECGHSGNKQDFRECIKKENKEIVKEGKLNFIENVDELPDMCYGVLPSDNSIIIVKKGEQGYYPTDYSDMVEGETYDERYKSANEIVNRLNAEIDITPDQRFTMEIRSMNGNWKNMKKESIEQYQNGEVPDEAYDIAEIIVNKLADKEYITMGEFDELYDDAKKEVNFDYDDLETDVRGILGYQGWTTNTSTGDLYTFDYGEKHPEVTEE